MNTYKKRSKNRYKKSLKRTRKRTYKRTHKKHKRIKRKTKRNIKGGEPISQELLNARNNLKSVRKSIIRKFPFFLDLNFIKVVVLEIPKFFRKIIL